MPLVWHQMRMKILTQESFPPLEKGVRGDLNFLLLRHYEESNRFLAGRRRNLTHLLTLV